MPCLALSPVSGNSELTDLNYSAFIETTTVHDDETENWTCFPLRPSAVAQEPV